MTDNHTGQAAPTEGAASPRSMADASELAKKISQRLDAEGRLR